MQGGGALNPAALDEMVFLSSIPERKKNEEKVWIHAEGGGVTTYMYNIYIYIYIYIYIEYDTT